MQTESGAGSFGALNSGGCEDVTATTEHTGAMMPELNLAAGETTSVAEYFRGVARSIPGAIALRSGDRRYTYAEIDRWSDAVAARLAALAAPRDCPVAIVAATNVPLVPAALGVVKAGHFYMTVDALDPDERIALLLRQANVAVCIVDSPERSSPAMSGRDILPLGTVPTDAGQDPRPSQPHDLLNLVFTSGTTGRPKAIATRQHGFVADAVRRPAREAPGSAVMFKTLPGYVRANTILGPLLNGSTLVAFDARDESLSALASFIVREKLTSVRISPAVFRRLMREQPPELDLSAVRRVRCGTDIVTPADVELFKRHFPRGCVFEHGYASSETGGGVFSIRIDHDTPVPGPLVPMGHPATGVEVRLLDDEGKDVPDGEPGELFVTSDGVVDGYWNDPELTAERFTSDPRNPGRRTFRTGDLVMRDAAGMYYFAGRKDFRIRIHNRRIDPFEVENALLACSGVREAVAVAKPDHYGEMRLVAYVVMSAGHPCEPRAIRRDMRARVPVWMIPVQIHALDRMPVSPTSGKVDRKGLMARQDPPPPARDSGASDDLERRLVEIWSRILGMPVHVHDDWFDDLGGESIAAAHLVTALEKDVTTAIPLSLIVELNTVRKMAEYIRSPKPEKPLAVLIQRGTDAGRPPLFITAGAGGAVVKYRALAQAMGAAYTVYGIHAHGFSVRNFPKSWAGLLGAYADAIRSIQPNGPYFLAGYSSGGSTAVGLADWMRKHGEEVAFVGAIDTAAKAPLLNFWRRALNRISTLVEHPRRIARLPNLFRKRLRKKTRRLLRNQYLEQGPHIPKWLADTRQDLQRATKSNAKIRYDGDVVVFRARDGVVTARSDKDLGWSRVPVRSFRIVDVDGDHGTVLDADVQSLAQAMVNELEEARMRVAQSSR
jgi:amino acid adenylation domain-containing protein